MTLSSVSGQRIRHDHITARASTGSYSRVGASVIRKRRANRRTVSGLSETSAAMTGAGSLTSGGLELLAQVARGLRFPPTMRLISVLEEYATRSASMELRSTHCGVRDASSRVIAFSQAFAQI